MVTFDSEDLVQDLQNLWMSTVCPYNFQQSNTVFFKRMLMLPMADIECADSECFCLGLCSAVVWLHIPL